MSKNKIILITGGQRSGKSRYALHLSKKLFKTPLFLATAEVSSGMEDRIKRHQMERGENWKCIEEPIDIAARIKECAAISCDGILLDCLTVWLGNIFHHEGAEFYEKRKQELLAILDKRLIPMLIVTNEIGSGIIPATEMSRTFVDYAGWLNQAVADIADTVVFMVSGQALKVKGDV